MNQGFFAKIMDRFLIFHQTYMQDFTNEYGLIALMSFMFFLSVIVGIILIPFTIYMGLPIGIDFLFPVFFGIIPAYGWSRVVKKWAKHRYTLQFYPEKLI